MRGEVLCGMIVEEDVVGDEGEEVSMVIGEGGVVGVREGDVEEEVGLRSRGEVWGMEGNVFIWCERMVGSGGI